MSDLISVLVLGYKEQFLRPCVSAYRIQTFIIYSIERLTTAYSSEDQCFSKYSTAPDTVLCTSTNASASISKLEPINKINKNGGTTVVRSVKSAMFYPVLKLNLLLNLRSVLRHSKKEIGKSRDLKSGDCHIMV